MDASNQLDPFPPQYNFDTVDILKQLTRSRSALGELRGTVRSLPNQGVLIDTLLLQEALASSEIENIVTTQDEVFQADSSENQGSPEAKEVARYRQALHRGYLDWKKHNLISERLLIEMFRILKQRSNGYRTGARTVLRNEQTGETVYRPPQDRHEIISLMRDLEHYINADESSLDPLIKMALIHYQFESIHPFPTAMGVSDEYSMCCI